MTTEKGLVKAGPSEIEVGVNWDARIAGVKGQVDALAKLLQTVLKKDVDYGTVPGTKRPTLYKPGAEKVLKMMDVFPDPIIEDLSIPPTPEDPLPEVRYRIKVIGYKYAPDGEKVFIGGGVGEASSNEEKYRWRAAVCKEEFEETPDHLRREKWRKTWNNQQGKYDYWKAKQIRTEVADVANTILKMGKKRGMVDLAITVSGGSEFWTQDVEDMPEEIRGGGENARGEADTGEQSRGAATDDREQSTNQFNAIMKMLRTLGHGGEDEEASGRRHQYVGELLGKEVPKIKALTWNESSRLITLLGEEINKGKKSS